jgi:glycosyltransferase involved in cell wall biosynthesis
MKLLIATGIFHPETGGPATYLREILPLLQARGHEVRVITFGDDTQPRDYGYPVQRIPRRALPIRMLGYGLAARPLLAWADVVYMHTLGLPLWGTRRAPRIAKIVGDVAWERSIRKGWLPPTTDIDTFQTQRYDNLLVENDKARRAAEACGLDAIVVPSEYLKRMVVGWGVDAAKVRVIYNAMPPSHPAPLSRTSPPAPLSVYREGEQESNADVGTRHAVSLQAREALGLPADTPLLLTAARLTAWKGVQYLIPALRAVSDVRLLVAGDGEMLPELRALAAQQGVAERVDFLGNVSREKMPLYLRAADYLALYSGYEGLSHTLLEALREGTPVIASNKGGNPEVVQHGVNGLLVPYVDVEALAAALREAFAAGKQAALAANSGVGMERFAFEAMVAQTAAVLEQYGGI